MAETFSLKGARSTGVGIGEVCHCDSITTMQYAVKKFYRCVVELQMKAKVIDGGGPKPPGRAPTVEAKLT